MSTPNKLPEIKKEAFIKARESLGLSTKDLSRMACLSVRQIEQIENGQTSTFYGPQVKVTAAKKVAGILKLNEEDAFDLGLITSNKKEVPREESKPSEKVSNQVQSLDKEISVKTDEVEQANAQANTIDSGAAAKNPKRKFYIFAGVAAALVFSVINLRPLFFPEAVK